MVENKNLIFIVAYNHESFVERVVARIPEAVLIDPCNELLIIDDASRDETFFISDQLKRKYPQARIRVLKNPVNQGYGGNQKIGYRYAIDHQFARVFLIHGDGQYDPAQIPEFLKAYEMGDADAVFGTRMASVKSAYNGGMPVYKIIGNKILTFLENRVLGSRLSEFHSGYRSYSVDLLKKIPFEANSNDFHFDTEIIIQCLAVKGKIQELPISTHYGDEVCHVDGMSYAYNVIKACLHFKLHGMGFFFDRKYDFQNYSYQEKTSRYSSHFLLSEEVRAGSRVLDIGCGTGQVAKHLIERGCTVDGIDIIEESQAYSGLRRYYQLDLSKEPKRLAAILATETYDYILMADIIEHLVSPESFLDLIRSSHRQSPAPEIVASTGNVGFIVVRSMLALGQFNYGPRGILDRTHTRLFTAKSFKYLFEQCGYKVDLVKPVPMPFDLVFGAKSRIGKFFEALNLFLLKIRPRLFAYQFIVKAEPLPTVPQLLELSSQNADRLRKSMPSIEGVVNPADSHP